jgi:hypothetical protein
MSQTRRLAAILAADVAGYSRLMGVDEEGTHERLKALRRELVDPKIAEHHGRIVKTTGDGLLVEFASVVDAVRCAVEVQRAMPERNAGIAADTRIELRIGINLGDVIAHWLKKAGLTPRESKTTVAHLDTGQRNDLFNDFVQRIALFRQFAAYQRTPELGKTTAQEGVPLDAKEREALFREFTKYQKIPSIIVAYHETAVDH